MSDLNVIVAPVKSLEIAKDGATVEGHQQVKPEQKQDKVTKRPVQTKLTDLSYAIDHEDNALHLKVKSADGEVVREVVFDRIDPRLLDPKKLKGIFVDGNS